MNEMDFIRHYATNAPHLMWFLGAGTSRTAGLPTATDIIWDLKLKYYCREENQDIKNHDITNETIRRRIQGYLESKGCPTLWAPEEYSFYFDLTFGDDYSAQQKYLTEALANSKISLNIGHRALAGLLTLNKAKIIFTTNFDEVIETAFAKVSGAGLSAYHLEGSYAALDAFNSERFPLYAKIHGDFKYQSIKNLRRDLLDNDNEIRKCFLAACGRFGMVVSGYSGRDSNVMSMFNEAIEQNNAFSAGLFWTVTSMKNVPKEVQELIAKAKAKGIKAHVVETGTFDIMLSKIWRQIPDRTDELDKKVRTTRVKEVNIPIGPAGTSFPVLRLNALPIVSVPENCALIRTTKPLSMQEVKNLLISNPTNALVSKTDRILGFGAVEDLKNSLRPENVQFIEPYKIEEAIELIHYSTGHHSFFERALAKALVSDKPLRLVNDGSWLLSVDHLRENDPRLTVLKTALADKFGTPGLLHGKIYGTPNTFWSEAVGIKLEKQNGSLWVTLNPTVWIHPRDERKNNKEFVKKKTGNRYNPKTSKILDAWISILFGDNKNMDVEVTCNSGTDYPATFKINTRTAYSRK